MALVVAKFLSTQDESVEVAPEALVFENDKEKHKHLPQLEVDFKEAVNIAYLERTSLSATGFYKTPEIHFDRDKGIGKSGSLLLVGRVVAMRTEPPFAAFARTTACARMN